MGKGIIKGFVGGVGKGMAEIGKMQMAANLKKESGEADDIRSRALNKDRQDFTATENQKNRTSAEGIAKNRAKASAKDNRTTQQKNVAAMKGYGWPDDIAEGIGMGSIEVIKDPDSNDTIAINFKTGKRLGRLTDVKGEETKQWIAGDEQPISTAPTINDIKSGKDRYDKEANFWDSDQSQFGMKESQVKIKMSEEARDTRVASEKVGGVVNTAKGQKTAKPAEQKKQAKMPEAEYRKKLKEHYKDKINDAQIEKMYQAARKSGRVE